MKSSVFAELSMCYQIHMGTECFLRSNNLSLGTVTVLLVGLRGVFYLRGLY